MPRKPITLAFNPDTMTVSDLKDASKALASIMRLFEIDEERGWSEDQLQEEVYLTALQYRDAFRTWAKED